MIRIFRYHPSGPWPDLDWVQLEISSKCNASCIYCPQSEYRRNWQNSQVSLETIRSLLPSLAATNHIHLQGWGEPFTHPGILEILTMCKSAGHMVSTTTNGSLLSSDSIEEIVTRGLDIIAFSLAGMDKRNDTIRLGNSLKKTLAAISGIQKAKAKHGTDKPRIHLAYMLLRSGLDDLARIPDFFGNVGVDQVVISSLSLIVRPELADESFTTMNHEEYSDMRMRLHEMRYTSKAQGVDVFFHVVSPQLENTMCSENIAGALFIGSDGGVSPCVMANIPVKGDVYHYLQGIRIPHEKIIFGNINNQRFIDIWNQKEYRRFRRSFSKDHRRFICNYCQKLQIDDLSGDMDW